MDVHVILAFSQAFLRCWFLRAFASAMCLFPLAAMWDGINTHARQSNAVMKLISSWLDYCSGLLADCPTKTNHLWQAAWSTRAYASPRRPLSHHYFACLLSISDDKDRQPHHSHMQKIALMYTHIRKEPQRKKCVCGNESYLLVILDVGLCSVSSVKNINGFLSGNHQSFLQLLILLR